MKEMRGASRGEGMRSVEGDEGKFREMKKGEKGLEGRNVRLKRIITWRYIYIYT